MKINKKNIKYTIDDHHHGLYVKEARLRLGYRLSEVADEICDVSYLSKIEAGRMIPSVEVFEKIVEKLEIQFPSEKQLCSVDLFRKALYQKDMNLILPYLTHETLHHYEIRMLEFFRYVELGQLEKATVVKDEIDQFRFHFQPKKEQAYLLFAGVYHLKSCEWVKGKQHLEKSFKLMEKNKEEDPYLYLQLAKYYFRVEKAFIGFIWLERATTEFRRMFEQKWCFECDMLWCKESLNNGDVDAVEVKIEEWKKLLAPSYQNTQWDRIFNITALFHEKKENYELAESYHLKSIEKTDRKIQEICLIDTINFYYHRQKRAHLIKLIEKLNLSELNAENRTLIDFYYLKLTEEGSEFFESFLKKDAIPLAAKRLDRKKVILYTKELTKYYRGKLSYKKLSDAYYELEKFLDALSLAGKV